ncbi:MAG: MMPL family transporter [Actinomycetota bacterium]
MEVRLGGPLARAFAFVVVHLRVLVVPGWIALAVLATIFLPSLNDTEATSLSSLVPKDSAAVAAERAILREFGFPLFSRVQIVQRDPNGLSPAAQARVVGLAADIDRGLHRSDYPGILGAIPVTNTRRLMPGSREDSTAAITYLFVNPRYDIYQQRDLAEFFAHREVNQPDDHLVGVTGAVPARADEGDTVTSNLPWVELATVALIALIVGVHFRSPVAPLVTLAAAGIAYLVTIRVLVFLGQRAKVSVPQEIEPLVVVLLLGIVTDYSVFFLSGMRARLGDGWRPVAAAKATTGDLARIILTAGMVVASASAALVVTSLSFFRALGPGLAVTVVIGLLVSVTFVPGVMALFGRGLFWPNAPPAGPARERATTTVGAGASAAGTTPPRVPPPTGSRVLPDGTGAERGRPDGSATRGWRVATARAVTRRPVALVVSVVVGGGLVLAATFLRQTTLGISLPDELPGNAEPAVAARAAWEGFAPGITSPTEVILQGVHGPERRLVRLTGLVSRQPGVAGVIGPGTLPSGLPQVFVSNDGTAARLVVILDRDPLGSSGLDRLGTLERRMPDLLRRAGLSGVTAGFAGDSALARETVNRTEGGLGAIAVAALAADLLLLIVFLRALVAPVYLLACSALVVAAALGLTTLVFQDWFGHPGLTYYVPFAAAVLLVALGSDYNVFVVGRIWQEARTMPLREAIRVAAPRASRAIGVAGLALAGSFALLAIVPLVPFREFAFAMAVGVLLDSFLVRTFLVPSLMTLFSPRLDTRGEPPPASGT